MTALALGAAALASRQDFAIEVRREAQSNASPETLGQAIEVIGNWKRWIRGVAEAKAVDFRGVEYALRDQTVMTGSRIRLKLESGATLVVQALDSVPGRKIVIGVLEDPGGALPGALWPIEWTIELAPLGSPGGGTRINGKLRVKTAGWTARLLGSLFPTTVGMQVFYPDVTRLALITQPDPTNPLPDYAQ